MSMWMSKTRKATGRSFLDRRKQIIHVSTKTLFKLIPNEKNADFLHVNLSYWILFLVTLK